MNADHEISQGLAAGLPEGRQYVLSNRELRHHYGRRRITADTRRWIADDLRDAGLLVVSDPAIEPLVVARGAPPPSDAGGGDPPATGSPAPTRRRPFHPSVLLGLGGTAATILSLWTTNDVQRVVCQQALARVPVAQGAVVRPCAAKYRPVDRADAQTAVDRFFEGLSGANPAKGWRMLSPSFRDTESRRDWIAEWRQSLWAETSAPEKVDGYNTYEVDVRDYEPTGEQGRRWRVRVRHTPDGGLELTDADILRRVDEPARTPRRVVYRTASDLWQRPRSDSTVTLPARSREITPGGRLQSLCQIHHAARTGRPPTDPDWWTRTNLGWIPNQALEEDGRDGRLRGLGDCYAHWSAH
jgi:hypothetical protein